MTSSKQSSASGFTLSLFAARSQICPAKQQRRLSHSTWGTKRDSTSTPLPLFHIKGLLCSQDPQILSSLGSNRPLRSSDGTPWSVKFSQNKAIAPMSTRSSRDDQHKTDHCATTDPTTFRWLMLSCMQVLPEPVFARS